MVNWGRFWIRVPIDLELTLLNKCVAYKGVCCER